MTESNGSIEVKVGALVLFAIALLAGFVLVLGDFSFSEGRRLHVEFDNAAGLKPGADVAIAGLNVGQVQSLAFQRHDDEETGSVVSARATLRVDREHFETIRTSSNFYISRRGVLGEPYIEIVTRSFEAPTIEPGSTHEGVSPPRIDLLTAKAKDLLDALTSLFEDPDVTLAKLVQHGASLMAQLDDFVATHRKDLDGSVSGAHATIDEAERFLKVLNRAVGEGDELEETLDHTRKTAARADSISRKVDRRVGPITEDLAKTAERAENVSASTERLVHDNEEKLQESIDHVHASTEDLERLSGDAREVVGRIRKGKGTVGQLLNDRKMYDDMRELLRIVKRQPWRILWKE
jgi:phospholipid/cholesterol/gamma-HCH transport system substrate-binding protein